MNNDMLKNMASLLLGPHPVEIDKDMTANVKNSQEGPVINIESKSNSNSISIKVDDHNRAEALKNAIVYVSDLNHAAKNGIKTFPLPKNETGLCRYIDTRDTFLTYIYKGEKKKLLSSHNDIYVKLETLEHMTSMVTEEEEKKKKKNAASGGSPNIIMTLDEMVADIADSQSDKGTPVFEQDYSYER